MHVCVPVWLEELYRATYACVCFVSFVSFLKNYLCVQVKYSLPDLGSDVITR